MPTSIACLHYHIVFSTKNRHPYFVPEIRQRVYDYIGGIVKSGNGVLIAAGGSSDHVHLLTSLYKTHTQSPMISVPLKQDRLDG